MSINKDLKFIRTNSKMIKFTSHFDLDNNTLTNETQESRY